MSRSCVLALVVLLVFAALPGGAQAQEFQVIVHPSNPATSLTREQVSRLFLKKTSTWEDGLEALPVDQPTTSAVRAAFSKAQLKKSVHEVKAYWQQQLFSGRAVPPPEKNGDGAVVAFVEATRGAIGYVSATASTGQAKVVRVE